MKDIVDSLQNVSDELLLKLNLNWSIRHEKGIRDSYINALYLVVVCLLSSIAATVVLIVSVHEIGFLGGRLSSSVSGVKINVPRINYPLIVTVSVDALTHVHMNHYHVLATAVLLLVFRNRVVICIVCAWPSTNWRCHPLRIYQCWRRNTRLRNL